MDEREKNKSVQLTVKVKTSLHDKLLNHLQKLKSQNHPDRTQNAWVLNAILSKMERDEASQVIPKARNLALKFDETLTERLEARIEEISKTIPHYTKKQWILDAIEEKLEMEKEIMQKKLAEYRQGLNELP
jgi:hypothetical protein